MPLIDLLNVEAVEGDVDVCVVVVGKADHLLGAVEADQLVLNRDLLIKILCTSYWSCYFSI